MISLRGSFASIAIEQTFIVYITSMQEDEKLVDPYVLFQFCGKEVRFVANNH